MNEPIPAPAERGQEWLFAPWDHAENWWPLYLFLGFLVGAAVVYYLHRRAWNYRNRVESWARMRRICHERYLSPDEVKSLVAAINEAGVTSPDSAVISGSYFDTFVAPVLGKRYGHRFSARIADKLFSAPPKSRRAGEEEAHGTRILEPGQELRLQSPSGTNISGVVVDRSDEGFSVAVSGAAAGAKEFHDGEAVEGSFQFRNALYAFRTHLREIVGGAAPVLRLRHTEDMAQIRQRSGVRVEVNRSIQFTRLEATGRTPPILGAVEMTTENTFDGVLRNLSLGGCAIEAAGRPGVEEGNYVQFEVPVTEEAPPLRFLGRVVRVVGGDQQGYDVHMEFVGLSSAARHAILQAIARKLRTEKGKRNRKTTDSPPDESADPEEEEGKA